MKYTKEQLRMQQIAGIITESEYKKLIKENQDVDKLRIQMGKLINQVNNDENLSEEEKESRVENIKFVIYDVLDPNTNGGARPPKDFSFDDNWWNSIPEDIDHWAIDSAYTDLERAVGDDSSESF
jgi:hypothetical protein